MHVIVDAKLIVLRLYPPVFMVRLPRITVESATGNIGLLWGAPKCGSHDPYHKAKTFLLFGSMQAVFRCMVTAQTGVGLKRTAEAGNEVNRSGGGVQVFLQSGITGKGVMGSFRQCPSPEDFVLRQGDSPEIVTTISLYQPSVKRSSKHATSGSHSPYVKNGRDGGEKTSNKQAQYILECLESLRKFVKEELVKKKVNVLGRMDGEANVVAWSSPSGSSHTALGMLQAGLTSLTGCLHGSQMHEPVIFRVGEFSPRTFCRLLRVVLKLCAADGAFRMNSEALSSHDEIKIWDCLNSAGMSPYGSWAKVLRKPVGVDVVNQKIYLQSNNYHPRTGQNTEHGPKGRGPGSAPGGGVVEDRVRREYAGRSGGPL